MYRVGDCVCGLIESQRITFILLIRDSKLLLCSRGRLIYIYIAFETSLLAIKFRVLLFVCEV